MIAFRARPTWFGAGTLALLLVAYAGSFRVPFLFDDIPAIVANPYLDPPIRFPASLGPDLPGGVTTAGRPLLNLSFALNVAAHGRTPAGFHVVNLAIHAAAGFLLLLTLARVLRRPACPAALRAHAAALAAITAAWWLLHPLATAAVTYVVQRAESLAALAILAGLYSFTNYAETARRPWAFAAVLAAVLGLAVKETVVVLPLLILLFDAFLYGGSPRAALAARPRFYLALAATWLLLLALLLGTGARGDTAGLAAETSVLSYALTQVHAVPHYLRLALLPFGLVFDHGQAVITAPARLLLPGLVFLALLAATAHGLRRRALWALPAAAWFLLLAPSSSLIPVATQTIAEHRPYLALASPLVLLAALLVTRMPRHATLVALIVAGGLTVLTAARNHTFADPVTLWADTAAQAPANPRAHINLGLALHESGDHPAARAAYERALALDPAHAETHFNLGLTLTRLADLPAALAAYERAVALDPARPAFYQNLSLTHERLGNLPAALAASREAVRLAPADAAPPRPPRPCPPRPPRPPRRHRRFHPRRHPPPRPRPRPLRPRQSPPRTRPGRRRPRPLRPSRHRRPRLHPPPPQPRLHKRPPQPPRRSPSLARRMARPRPHQPRTSSPRPPTPP